MLDTTSNSDHISGLTSQRATTNTMNRATLNIEGEIPDLPKGRIKTESVARGESQTGVLNSVQPPNSHGQPQPPSLRTLSLVDPMDLPPKEFPTLMSAPDLPLRMQDQSEVLSDLDHVFNRKMYSLDGKRMVDPLVEDTSLDTSNRGWKVKETIREDKVYERLEARMPYVQLASSRLQAICGVRNDTEFTLPSISPAIASGRTFSGQLLTPTMRRVFGDVAPQKTGPLKRAHSEDGMAMQYKNGGRGGISSGHNQSLEAMGGIIDKETGRGLREYLLQMGKEHGMRKRHCESLSMFDLTPELKFNSPRNQKLQHFTEKDGYRIDVYEVDLPTTQTNSLSGATEVSVESWIWFFISHSLIDSPDPSKLSTHPPTTDPAFPYPVPDSWVLFALPVSHCNQYETETEFNTADSPPVDKSQPAIETTPKILRKRIDYDLSFQGLPIFEFSHKPEVALGGWYDWCQQNNVFNKKSRTNPAVNYYFEGEHGRFLNVKGDISDCQEGDEGWWGTWYWKVFRELLEWEKVKLAMGRGKCRVVIRWRETETIENTDTDSLLKMMYADAKAYGTPQKGRLAPGIGFGRGLGLGGGLGLGIDVGAGVKGLACSRGRRVLSRGGPTGPTRSVGVGFGRGTSQNGPRKSNLPSLNTGVSALTSRRPGMSATRKPPPAITILDTSNFVIRDRNPISIAEPRNSHTQSNSAQPGHVNTNQENQSTEFDNESFIGSSGMSHSHGSMAPINIIATHPSSQNIPMMLPNLPTIPVSQSPDEPETTAGNMPPPPPPTLNPASNPKNSNSRKGKGKQRKRK